MIHFPSLKSDLYLPFLAYVNFAQPATLPSVPSSHMDDGHHPYGGEGVEDEEDEFGIHVIL